MLKNGNCYMVRSHYTVHIPVPDKKVFWINERFFQPMEMMTSRSVTCLVMLSLFRQNHQRPDFFGILSLTQDSTVAWKQPSWVSLGNLLATQHLLSMLAWRTGPYYGMWERERCSLHTSQTRLAFLTPPRDTACPTFMAAQLCDSSVAWDHVVCYVGP